MLSGTAHDSANPNQFDSIHGADGDTPAGTDTAAVIRMEHSPMLLCDTMPPEKMGTGAASLAEGGHR